MGDPGAFMGAMQGGMDAFATSMQGGGDIASAGQAFMDAAGPMCSDMGMDPGMFDGMCDAFGDCAGFAMQGMPADAPPADMGACMMDAATMCMGPDAGPMPPEMGDMFGSMADTMADCGCGPHDMGAEMGPPMQMGLCRASLVHTLRKPASLHLKVVLVMQQE